MHYSLSSCSLSLTICILQIKNNLLKHYSAGVKNEHSGVIFPIFWVLHVIPFCSFIQQHFLGRMITHFHQQET